MIFTQAAKRSSTRELAIFAASSSEPQVIRTTIASGILLMRVAVPPTSL
jgi:hypothetical protein